ncbi:MAG: DUF1553 domain-containing protein [Acidobacteria bacterium]|nr:DUF1553 domain-containing protein [Acidobacteriota bacterium]
MDQRFHGIRTMCVPFIKKAGTWLCGLLFLSAWVHSEQVGAEGVLPPAAKIKVEFSKDIQPLLAEACQSCHGGQQQLGGLRLDSRAAALAGGKSGAVIKPGNSADSKLIHLVAGIQKDQVMPMTGQRLTAEQVGLLRAWIDQGIEWPTGPKTNQSTKSQHWAFRPPQRPRIPRVKNRDWVKNPIDAFVFSKLESEGIKTSAETDRDTLIRRVSLDLTGLPPTPEEVSQFLADSCADAYERLVDHLLASPHYGEKWARQWLDLARYADSDGYEKDLVRPHAWRWRHWVIAALNRNMPFDQFTIEQIAGDLLPDAGIEQKVATGFNRNTLTNREGGVDKEEFRVEQVIDRVATVGTVWLGLTLGCARCHDHKYDPISQKEFYESYAFFNSSVEVNLDAPLPGELGPYLLRKPEYDKKREALLTEYKVKELQEEWEKDLREIVAHPGTNDKAESNLRGLLEVVDWGKEILLQDPKKRTPKQRKILTDHFVQAGFKELSTRLATLEEEYPGLTEAQTLDENPSPPKSHVLIRGDFRRHGVEVQPRAPAVLPPLPPDAPPSRLTLARWLVSENHPLTARVTVNRMWQEFFGQGLVLTSQDFGTRGDLPSHPELLDWLATEFVANGWNVKKMHKLIVQSAAYRQSSATRKDLESRDVDNRLLARQSRLRLPAELIRDSTLAVSGLLNPAIGGMSIRPPQPAGIAELSFRGRPWKESEGMDRYRRGLYIFFLRSIPYPQLATFDAPDSLSACSRRERSTTPLQALTLLNDPVFSEAARSLAVRVLQEKTGNVSEQLEHAFRLSLSRLPKPNEKNRLLKYYYQKKEMQERSPESIEKQFPAKDLEGIDTKEAAIWVGISRVLLNLDEFITRN